MSIKPVASACLTCLIAGMLLSPLRASASTLPELPNVPRSIDDVAKLLNSAVTNQQAREEAERKIKAPAPANASPNERFAHYYLKAQAAESLGMVKQRLESLKEAMHVAEPNSVAEIVSSQEFAIAESQAGNPKEAFAILQGALPKIPERVLGMATGFYTGLVAVHAMMGDFAAAEKNLKELESLIVMLRRGNAATFLKQYWEASYYLAVANLARQQGKFSQAEVAYKRAFDLREAALPDHEKLFARSAGVASESLGLTVNPNTVKTSQELVYLYLSEVVLQLQKTTESEYYTREALKRALARTGKSSIPTSMALRQLAIVMLAQGRNKDAIFLLKQSLDGLQAAGVTAESIALARVRKTLASAYIASENYAEALKIYTDLDKTAQQFPQTARFVDPRHIDRVLVLERTGNPIVAEKMARELLAVAEQRTGKRSSHSTQARLMLATVLAAQTRDAEAQSLFAEGMAAQVEQQKEMASEAESISSKEKNYLLAATEAYLGVLSRMYKQNPSRAIAAEAFRLGDIARASSVQRALSASTARANIQDPRLADLARKEQDLRQRITFLTRFTKELAMAPLDQQLPDIQAKIKQDLEALRKEAAHTEKLIELDFPDYADLISPKPATLDKVQKTIRDNELLVSWFIGRDRSYVWAIPATGEPQFLQIATQREQLGKAVAQLRKALDPQVLSIEEIPPFDFNLASRLYDDLLKPVQAGFAGKDTLVLIPHGDLGQLPLGILLTAPYQASASKEQLLFTEYRNAPWLMKKMALVSLPSATAMTSLRSLPKPKAGRHDFIAFGDPIFSLEQAKGMEKPETVRLATRGVPLKLRNTPKTSDVSSAELALLPRLPDTSEEVLEIAKVFKVDPQRDIYLQTRANLTEVLKADLANRKVVMFSTHGLVPGELDGLTQPALALTNPQVMNAKGDGLLKVDQILTLKLNADWVVLSACNTASGEGAGAEALSGLGRAFFFAGARSLLVSSWPVDSEASRKLMTDLFRRQAKTTTLSKPEVLRQASLALLEKGRPDGEGVKYSYAHPLFWAPFTVVGD